MELLEELEAYQPWNEQEERDRAELLRRLKSGEELYSRENLSAHLTASAWVVSPDRKKVLMAYHKLYDSWAWLGGHADGMEDLQAVAEKEVREESGTEVPGRRHFLPGNSHRGRPREAGEICLLPSAPERHLSV